MPVFTVDERYTGALRASGLDRFERVMAAAAAPGAVTRAVPGRFTTRLELRSHLVDGAGPVVYLKRYQGPLLARAAGHEWRRLHEAAAAGIPCPRPVAFGERRGLLGPTESFLITEEIPRAVQADWWIADHRERRPDLVDAAAALARRFHDAGFHHQDFYLCHFFVREAEAAEGPAARPPPLELFLIDFQRCGRPGRRRRRVVKDLAQLHFSFGQVGFGPEDWRGFLARYGASEPALLRAVLRKSARIARHVPRYG